MFLTQQKVLDGDLSSLSEVLRRGIAGFTFSGFCDGNSEAFRRFPGNVICEREFARGGQVDTGPRAVGAQTATRFVGGDHGAMAFPSRGKASPKSDSSNMNPDPPTETPTEPPFIRIFRFTPLRIRPTKSRVKQKLGGVLESAEDGRFGLRRRTARGRGRTGVQLLCEREGVLPSSSPTDGASTAAKRAAQRLAKRSAKRSAGVVRLSGGSFNLSVFLAATWASWTCTPDRMPQNESPVPVLHTLSQTRAMPVQPG